MARTFAMSMTVAAVALLWTSAGAAAEPPAYAIGKCVDPSQPVPQRPAQFDYNCDATGVMQDMVWTSWDRDGARGSSTDTSIECQPNCAQGARLTDPIVVHLLGDHLLQQQDVEEQSLQDRRLLEPDDRLSEEAGAAIEDPGPGAHLG